MFNKPSSHRFRLSLRTLKKDCDLAAAKNLRVPRNDGHWYPCRILKPTCTDTTRGNHWEASTVRELRTDGSLGTETRARCRAPLVGLVCVPYACLCCVLSFGCACLCGCIVLCVLCVFVCGVCVGNVCVVCVWGGGRGKGEGAVSFLSLQKNNAACTLKTFPCVPSKRLCLV